MKNKTKLLLRDAFFSTILSSIIVLLLVLVFFNLRWFNPIHKAFYDFSFLDVFYSEKFLEPDKINTDIVLVNAGKDREQIVELLDKIIEAEPKVIGVDIIFKDKKKDVYVDSVLAALLKKDNIIASYEIDKKSIIPNHPYFGNSKSGFVNFNFDSTTVVREFQGYIKMDGMERASFGVQVSKNYLEDKWNDFDYDRKLRRLQAVKYSGKYDSFLYLEYDDFNAYKKKKILKDKIVILGYLGSPTGSEFDIEDKSFTPLNKYSVGKSVPDMFGTTLHANIINMLIKNNFMVTISNTWLVIITFLCMYLSTLFYMKINRKYKISFRTRKRTFQFFISLFVIFLSFWLFKLNVVLKPTIIIVGIILAGSYFKYYKHLTRYLKSKTNKKWKTYLK